MTSSKDKLSKSEEPKYEFSLNAIATVFYCGLYRTVGDGMGGRGSSVEGLSFWKMKLPGAAALEMPFQLFKCYGWLYKMIVISRSKFC